MLLLSFSPRSNLGPDLSHDQFSSCKTCPRVYSLNPLTHYHHPLFLLRLCWTSERTERPSFLDVNAATEFCLHLKYTLMACVSMAFCMEKYGYGSPKGKMLLSKSTRQITEFCCSFIKCRHTINLVWLKFYFQRVLENGTERLICNNKYRQYFIAK